MFLVASAGVAVVVSVAAGLVLRQVVKAPEIDEGKALIRLGLLRLVPVVLQQWQKLLERSHCQNHHHQAHQPHH